VSEKGFLGMLLVLALLVWPLIPAVPYDLLNTAILASRFLIVSLSLVLLIGMVGQISLAQASFVGMGAFISAIAAKRFGVYFPLTLLVGVAAGAITAMAIGMVALRVRGLYLAVATLIFAFVCDQYLFSQSWLVENQSGTSVPAEVIGKAGTFPFFDLADSHAFYYVALAVAVTALYLVANLRDSRVGRAFSAVRGSEVAAASLGIDVQRFKLLGFACAGGLAGLAGSLTLAGQHTVSPDQFTVMKSLFFLSIVAVGGLRSIGGAVASSLLFAGLIDEVFYRSPTLADYLDLISAGLLIVVLLFFRGGLGALPERLMFLRRRVGPIMERAHELLIVRPVKTPLAAVAKRIRPSRPAPAAPAERVPSAARRLTLPSFGRKASASRLDVTQLAAELVPRGGGDNVVSLPTERLERIDRNAVALRERAAGLDRVAGEPGPDGRRMPEVLKAQDITVQFGGLTAVNSASLRVGAGEIVGLIGPNGAGKTTLFNSILGLNQPTSGGVEIMGRSVSGWPVHRRAALGVGRTFQVLQLFPDLTVFDNLLVATHLQNSTGLVGSLLVTSASRRREQDVRERVRATLRLMNLEHFADRKVAGLPFGVLRLVEVARTLVTGARLVCFDEPASGLDSTETEALIEWFRLLRNIGVTLLVIEHDVDMVVRLCDYIYVLDQGKLIAEGTPDAIQRNPLVISSYLGQELEEEAS
jgi:ABC-type branched-subunit amino acid transport system ATPase component/ABC-type branched-subunit amino acid transport system permease subunit